MFVQITGRLTRMFTMKQEVYAEIRDDARATLQAAIVVVIASVLWAIGIGNRTGVLLGPMVLWLGWTSAAWLVGTRLLGGVCSWLGLARVLGYATAPFGLAVLGLVPCGGLLVAPLSWVLAAVLGFFGIREALELSSERALLTVLVSILTVPIAWALLTRLV